MEKILEIHSDGNKIVAWEPFGQSELAEAKIRRAPGKSEAEAVGNALRVLADRLARNTEWIEGGA